LVEGGSTTTKKKKKKEPKHRLSGATRDIPEQKKSTSQGDEHQLSGDRNQKRKMLWKKKKSQIIKQTA